MFNTGTKLHSPFTLAILILFTIVFISSIHSQPLTTTPSPAMSQQPPKNSLIRDATSEDGDGFGVLDNPRVTAPHKTGNRKLPPQPPSNNIEIDSNNNNEVEVGFPVKNKMKLVHTTNPNESPYEFPEEGEQAYRELQRNQYLQGNQPRE